MKNITQAIKETYSPILSTLYPTEENIQFFLQIRDIVGETNLIRYHHPFKQIGELDSSIRGNMPKPIQIKWMQNALMIRNRCMEYDIEIGEFGIC